MKTTRRSRGAKLTDQLIKSLRASLLACILTAILVFIVALLLRWDIFSEAGLHILTIVIKALSACFAGFLHKDFSIRRLWLLAGLSGMLYMLLSLVVFSLLSGEFAFKLSHMTDILMGFACAACACILRGMLDKRAEGTK
ncbi:MAG: TIGR04086 family membrane protein, partial [Clostridia bacterium]|nr:TIGR04086 family membrane protein [Clostridia bacterium]